MTFLDLCAGIGGFSLGLEWAGMKCAGQVEIEPFCNRVLEKHWPNVSRWLDIKKESDYAEYPAVDLVCGGYPCQPFSYAGKRKGTEDDRHLWPYVFKVVQTLRPAWCLFENVAGHVSLGLDQVLSDLESEAYTCQPLVIPACAVDASHRRDRVWIIANSHSTGRSQCNVASVATQSGYNTRVLNPDTTSGRKRWSIESGVGRVVNGIPKGLDRLRSLGNAVVPQVVYEIGRAIIIAERVNINERMERITNGL